MEIDELKEKLTSIKSKEDLRFLVSKLKIEASNMRSEVKVIELIEASIVKANFISDFETVVFLHGLLILQLEHDISNLNKIVRLLEKMKVLAHKINYKEGIAFYYSFSWYIEKIQGNVEKSRREILKAKKILNEIQQPDEFIYYFINYSYAVDEWLVNRNPNVVKILESCIDYFLEKCLYHSLAMSLGILIIIFQQTQNKKESIKLVRRLLSNNNLLLKMPEIIQSIAYFYIGFSHGLSFNLNEAEKYLLKTQTVLKPLYKKSIYSGYYLIASSNLVAISALQGRLELAFKRMKEVEDLLEEGVATKNLDSYNKKQIIHIFNLTKFYINSRLSNFTIKNEQELVQFIIYNLDKYYSNAIMFSEFLLNANLTKEQLINIKNLDNPSTRRVEHIIDFLIEKTIHTEEQQILRYTTVLQKRLMEERMTYVEKALADLLAAQEYYRIGRFAEIYPLLKKHKNQLDRIEVLEMRIFMEAFIQAGEFNNGDPLAPALHFMAIKRCREHNFTRLEETLLGHQQTLRRIALNRLA